MSDLVKWKNLIIKFSTVTLTEIKPVKLQKFR